MFMRYSASFGSALGITFGLLFLMQLLISTGLSPIVEDLGPHIVPGIRQVIKDTPVISDESPPPPPPVEERPTREQTTNDPSEFGNGQIRIPPPATIKGPIFTAMPNGNAMLIVAVQPVYPRRMLVKGIEGYVIVQFDVTTEGTTTNIAILETSNNGFNKSAIEAAGRLKYKPKVVDGQPQMVYGIMKQFTFEIED